MPAWKYLVRAETEALAYENHSLLNGIYNLMIEKADMIEQANLDELITKHGRNKILADEDERAGIANSIVRKKLAEYRRHGREVDFDKVISGTLREYKLHTAVMGRPRLLYNLLSISRTGILAKKDFHSFEPFVISRYEDIEKHKGFEEKDMPYKAGMLYMISHTLYRTRKFKQSRQYLEELQKTISGKKGELYNQYYPRYAQLQAALSVFEGDLSAAISTLKSLLKNKNLRLSHQDRLNALVSIGIYQFHGKKFRLAHDTLLEIYHTDKWCEKIMGREWVMKKGMMEVLLYYEMDHPDMVESRIRSVERKYRDLFDLPVYAPARTFLQLIRQVLQDPDAVRTEAFAQKVEASFDWKPSEQEDIQAIGFYAWLKSKMLGKDYQEVLMELMI